MFAGDFHCGSSLGLQPPVAKFDDGQVKRYSRFQAELFVYYLRMMAQVSAEFATVRSAILSPSGVVVVEETVAATSKKARRAVAPAVQTI